MSYPFKNKDQQFLLDFRHLTEKTQTVFDEQAAEEFIEEWKDLAKQAVLTANLSSLKLLLNLLRPLVAEHPQWQINLSRYSGRLAWIEGDYIRAARLFEEQQGLAKQQNNLIAIVKARLDLADVRLVQVAPAQVELLLQQSLALTQEHQFHLLHVQTLNRLGRFHQLQQHYELSQQYLEQALALVQQPIQEEQGQVVSEVELALEEAFGLQWQGANYAALRQWEQAELVLSQSLTICQQHHDVLGMLETMLKLGAVYHETERYSSALFCFEGSLAVCEQLHYLPALLPAYYYKARTHLALGSYQEALIPAQRAVEIGLETDQLEWLGQAFLVLGRVYHALKQYRLALICHLRIAQLYQPGNSNSEWIGLLMGAGDFLLDAKKYSNYWEEALECYRRAVNLVEVHQQLEYLAPMLGKMARAFTRLKGRGGLEDAARCFRLQLQLAGDLDSVALPPSVAVAMRVEALTGLQCCMALRVNESPNDSKAFGTAGKLAIV